MAELADAWDLKSHGGNTLWGFDSPSAHSLINWEIGRLGSWEKCLNFKRIAPNLLINKFVNYPKVRRVAQLVACALWEREVPGSNPGSPTN